MLKRSRLEDSPLSLAKRAFRQSSIPSVLVSREDHIHQIQLFWENHVKARKCNSMYVSGCPGTGKTAIVNHVLDQKQADDSRITIVNINCMHLSSPNSIHLQILTQLGITSTLKNSLSHLTQTVIQDSPIKKNSRVYLVVLDEIDHLVTNNANLLCSLFELCKQKNSRICIIGIANQIDLIDRFLSRLKVLDCIILLI